MGNGQFTHCLGNKKSEDLLLLAEAAVSGSVYGIGRKKS